MILGRRTGEEARDVGKSWKEEKYLAQNRVRWRSFRGPMFMLGVKGIDDEKGDKCLPYRREGKT
jgi:hypothetical protein